MRRVAAGFMIVAIAVSSAGAQPADPGDPLQSDRNGNSSGAGTKIPVSAGSTEVLTAESSGTSSIVAPFSVEQPVDAERYICGPGDVFELNFWGQQNFRLRIAVDLEGRTFVSKVGFIAVAGKTLSAVRSDIKKKVGKNYPGLQFDLTLVTPRTFVVHVVGNVKQPGKFVANPLERVSTLLSRAGDVTGSRRRVSIRRNNGSELTADLVLYELTGNMTHNPYVLDGDLITVPFAETVVTINGAVRRPGAYELIKTKDLTEALELAGGFTSAVARTLPIRLIRRNEKQVEAFTDVPFASESTAPNVALRDGDQLFVRGTQELQPAVLLIGTVVGADTVDTVTTSKRLPYIKGDTVLSLIERAGGLKAGGDLKRAYISRPSKPNTTPQIIPIDLEALFMQRDFTRDQQIYLNDTIVVPPMRHSILVEGAVPRAGLYNYNPRFGIDEYLSLAGGRTRTARDLDEVKLVDSNGVTHSYRPGAKPAPGDSILVPERNFTRAEVVQIVIAATGLVLSGVAITIAATR
jgi:polysaccharide biosynthesis/export protein